ncbi:hypothetical protein Btru_063431 [Bulinus truncatus]|nr:hypothetical protein Btru_063431 [Bulinus truncatus]
MAELRCLFGITWALLVTFILLHQVYCVDVSLEYSSSEASDDQMPEEVNVTLNTESSTLIKFHLRRAPHISPDIPLYTLSADDAGFYERKKFKSTNRKDLSFYQDLEKQAVFQITRSTEDGVKKSKLKLKGEFHLQGSTYAFSTDDKPQRKSWSPATSCVNSATTIEAPVTADVYTLVRHSKPTFDRFDGRMPRLTLTFDTFDGRVPPPEKKMSLRKNIPVYDQMPRQRVRANRTRLDLDASSWQVPLDRHRRDVITDYFVDVIAVIDYKLYLHFLSLAGQQSNQALQNILEHYAFVFNGVDMLYKGIRASYKIHIRLCQVHVLQTLSAANFVESHKIGETIDSDVVLSAFKNFSSTSGQNIVASFDHAMLFTAYDLTSLDNSFRISNSTLGKC